MGKNNLIDSSNFVNKILEIFELSYIYNIAIEKIDFVVSPEAFIHSIVQYNDGSITLNCFKNDMIITLIKPLNYFYNFDTNTKTSLFFNHKSYYFEKFSDERFEIVNNLKKFKIFSHLEVIQFMLLNNIAQKKYLSGKINYVDIIPFILKRIEFGSKKYKLKSLSNINKTLKILIKNYANY
jgi:1-deoxy-D-xylulose-5-phosphate reductoisomerase